MFLLQLLNNIFNFKILVVFSIVVIFAPQQLLTLTL